MVQKHFSHVALHPKVIYLSFSLFEKNNIEFYFAHEKSQYLNFFVSNRLMTPGPLNHDTVCARKSTQSICLQSSKFNQIINNSNSILMFV